MNEQATIISLRVIAWTMLISGLLVAGWIALNVQEPGIAVVAIGDVSRFAIAEALFAIIAGILAWGLFIALAAIVESLYAIRDNIAPVEAYGDDELDVEELDVE